MDIPLKNTVEKDIYDFGFDAGLNRSIPDNSTGVVYDAVGDSLNAAQVLQGGNLTLKTLSIGGLVRQVAPGDDIQAAIDAVNREGGGTVQLLAKTYSLHATLTMRSNVRLTGADIDVTILDFNLKGFLNSSGITNFSLERFSVKNPLVFGTLMLGGINIRNSTLFEIDRVKCTASSKAGFGVLGPCSDFRIANCEASDNDEGGFYISPGASLGQDIKRFVIESCRSNDHTGGLGVGFWLTFATIPSDGLIYAGELRNCTAEDNSVHGFSLEGDITDVLLPGCISNDNGSDGFAVACDDSVFIKCGGDGNSSGYTFDVSGSRNVFISHAGTMRINPLSASLDGKQPTTIIAPKDASTIIGFESQAGNFVTNGDETTQRRTIFTTQSSGGAILSGSVLIRDASAPQNATTTTTNGDDLVVGMALHSAAIGASTGILREGKTDLLLANNSATSISVGDFLSTYSHAYYAKKASAGETAFAIALSAPTTGTAQIDALLISPRLI